MLACEAAAGAGDEAAGPRERGLERGAIHRAVEDEHLGARVVPGPDRWTIRLPIPNSAIERPGRLRLAIEHIRGNARSTWPRAQFPWQTEPGRASVDLTKW